MRTRMHTTAANHVRTCQLVTVCWRCLCWRQAYRVVPPSCHAGVLTTDLSRGFSPSTRRSVESYAEDLEGVSAQRSSEPPTSAEPSWAPCPASCPQGCGRCAVQQCFFAARRHEEHRYAGAHATVLYENRPQRCARLGTSHRHCAGIAGTVPVPSCTVTFLGSWLLCGLIP